MAIIKDTIESFKAIQENLIELTADDEQLEARIKDEEYKFIEEIIEVIYDAEIEHTTLIATKV